MPNPAECFRARHPRTALAPYPGPSRAPAFVTIPDNAVGVSGMTAAEAIKRIQYHSREGACEKIEIADFGELRSVIPAKAGIDFSRWNKTLAWVPAFAGTTLRAGFQAFQPTRRFFHTLEGGIHFSCWNKTLAWAPAFAGATLRRNCPQEVLRRRVHRI